MCGRVGDLGAQGPDEALIIWPLWWYVIPLLPKNVIISCDPAATAVRFGGTFIEFFLGELDARSATGIFVLQGNRGVMKGKDGYSNFLSNRAVYPS